MKLNAFLYGLVLMIGIQSAIAQPYKPLLDDLNEWHFTTCYSGCNTSVYYTNGDTIVDGMSYKVLDAYHYISRTLLLREDVDAKEVYLLQVLPDNTKSFLLYDFKKTEGDTMELLNPMSPFIERPGNFILDSIRLKPLEDGEVYRHFYWSPTEDNDLPDSYPVWVEGVGSLSLINAPGGAPDFNGVGQLSCFFKNGTAFYTNMDSITTCVPEHFLKISELSLDHEISFVPNPTTGIINWNTNEIQSVVISDLNGKQLIEVKFDVQTTQMDLNALPDGIYLAALMLNNGNSIQKRIVLIKQ